MTAKLTFFQVGNGDMTLLALESGRTLLIDTNIRVAADDTDDETPDVAKELRSRLKRDSKGRLVLDGFLLSHPDQDHCAGLERHFHLGPPEEWSRDDDKILINELWSSPMGFRRASESHTLSEDAKAFKREFKRRVDKYRKHGLNVDDGDRVLVLGKDDNGETDDLAHILIDLDQEFGRLAGANDNTFKARLLAPEKKGISANGDDAKSKNDSSTILAFKIMGDGKAEACRFLTGGDAQVETWERLWQRLDSYQRKEWLSYDILLAPHHCSWHSLSYDSWSEKGKDAKVCPDARSALSQTRGGAVVVSSSESVKDDNNDPPCIRAKREYEAIVAPAKGQFVCVGDEKPDTGYLEYEIGWEGPAKKLKPVAAAGVVGSSAIGRQPLAHGD